jgi:hypothetical protein
VAASAVIEVHRRARPVVPAGVGSFVRGEGDGAPMVCMHRVGVVVAVRSVLSELAV